MKPAVSLCIFLLIALWARCYNSGTVFVHGDVYFVDPDCYSRMTRVRMVMEHPFNAIHHQDFENYPQGVDSHATSPFDYLIVLLAVLLKPFSDNYLDIAGALVSPLIGVAMAAFLWEWSRRLNLQHRWMLLTLAAISPSLVHGTVLGRPDHQSLQMLCVSVALGAEWCLLQKPSRGWGIAAGAAWGLGLWVSLYEPLILFLVVAILSFIFVPRKFIAKERWPGWAVFVGIIALMLLIDGVPVSAPDTTLLTYFPRWEKSVGELASTSIFNSLLYRWAGLALIAAPVLFVMRAREDKRAWPLFALLLLVWVLTLWQVRWGYFFCIVYAMSLPFQFAAFRKPLAAWCVFIVGLLPVFVEWNSETSGEAHAMVIDRTREAITVRRAAEELKSSERLPVLAPWWFSPEIAYWSGQPAVAGSSHESMPGIVDTSRFYLASDYREAHEILRARGVKRVIAYNPNRILENATELLRQPASESAMAVILFTRPHSGPRFLKMERDYYTLKVFDVVSADLQQ